MQYRQHAQRGQSVKYRRVGAKNDDRTDSE